MRIVITIIVLCLINGCASTLPPLEENEGYLVLSSGRDQSCDGCKWADPFSFLEYIIEPVPIDYAVDETYRVPAEAGLTLTSSLDDGHYGFAHAYKLPAGSYRMITFKRGTVFDPGGFISPAFYFKVSPNVVNYIGEFLTINDNLKHESIQITFKTERDLSIARKHSDELSNKQVRETRVTRHSLEGESVIPGRNKN